MKFLPCLGLLLALGPTARATLTPDVEYAVVDGESLKLDAYVPDGPGPFPAVILVHGGGWVSGDKSGGPSGALIAPMEAPLGRAGFAWFSINYRLAPKDPYPACIDDVETAIRWVKAHAAQYHLDPRRIALAGDSAGGHLVALAAVRADASTRVAAVVTFYGNFDLLAEERERGGFTLELGSLFKGRTKLDDDTTAFVKAASPIYLVKGGLPPFLLLHGNADTRVPYQRSVAFYAKLTAAGDRCEFITIPGGIHGMSRWEPLLPGFKEKVVAWLEKTMPAP